MSGSSQLTQSLIALQEAIGPSELTQAANYLNALGQIGQLGGISEGQFQACIDDQTLETKIFSSILEAQENYDIKSTPSFIINGKKHEGGMRFDAFAKTLDSYLPES